MIQKKFNTLRDLYRNELSYNEGNKEAFRKAGQAALKALAKQLEFKESRVSFNAGGIAVSGDHSMYGMFPDGTGVVLYLSKGVFSNHAGYFRAIRHMKDYTGGTNRWVSLEELGNIGQLMSELRREAKAHKFA